MFLVGWKFRRGLLKTGGPDLFFWAVLGCLRRIAVQQSNLAWVAQQNHR
jgi:hypothetical protein